MLVVIIVFWVLVIVVCGVSGCKLIRNANASARERMQEV